MNRSARFVAPFALLIVAGCAATSATVTTNAATTSPAATKAAEAAPTKPAGLGATMNINGENPGEKIAITLVKIVDPARGSDEFDTADPGKRLVGVQFRITDIGKGAYSDDPDNDAVVIDAQGQQYQPDIGTTIGEGASLNSGLSLARGDSTLGFEVFELPATAKVAKVQYQIDAGFAEHTAEWTAS